MFTYEINIICDKCSDHCFTSTVLTQADTQEAKEQARSDGWICDRDFALCPECYAKRLAERAAKASTVKCGICRGAISLNNGQWTHLQGSQQHPASPNNPDKTPRKCAACGGELIWSEIGAYWHHTNSNPSHSGIPA